MPWRRSLCHGTAAVVCLLLSALEAYSQTTLLPESTPVAELHNQVNELNYAVRQRTSLTRSHLRTRAALLSRLMERDPEEALRSAFPPPEAQALAEQFPMEPIERFSEWEGSLQTLIIDDFEHRQSHQKSVLQIGGKQIELHSTAPLPEFPCGTRVKVSGMRLQDRMVVTEVQQASGTNNASTCTTTGVQNVAVLLVSFPSTPNTTSVAQAQTAFFGSGRSLTNFWQEVSYGRTSATGSVFGPFTLDADYACDQNDQIAVAAIKAADSSVDFRNFTRIFIVMPKTGNCAIAVGTVGCGAYSSTGDGFFTASVTWATAANFTSNDTFVSIIAHEGGHNLGLDHSSTLDYGNIPLGPNAAAGMFDEYGDFYSMMGVSFTYSGTQILGHYTAQQKQKLGWFNTANVQTVTQNGTYVLNPLELISAGPQALRIRRGSSGSQYLWLEYRPALGNYDNSYLALPSNVLSGVLVHLEDPADPHADSTELLDFQPVSTPNSYLDAVFLAGRTWADPYSDLTLSFPTISPSAATISVSYANACAVVSSQSLSLTADAQNTAVGVTAPASCNWTASTATAWITLGTPSSGSGNGTVNFTVSANPSSGARSGSVVIGGQTVVVNQAGVSCSYAINLSSFTAPVGGGSGSINVTAAAGCLWNAASDSPWINVTAGSSGNGSGTVSFFVSANPGQSARSGKITVGSETLNITQPGVVLCSYVLNTTQISVVSGGGLAAINVTANAGCTWTAASNVGWITLTAETSGSGNGAVNLAVTANSGPARFGSITVAGQSVTVSQSGAAGSVALSGSLRFVPVTPCRLVDTRSGQGKTFPFGPPTMTAANVRDVPIQSAGCGIPAQAQAYSLNVTVVPQGPLSFLTIWPTGQAQPFVSTLNAPGGQVVANAALVPAGLNGSVSVYVTNATDLVIDINGYFTNAPPAGVPALVFHPVAPCRVMDTRAGEGTTGAFGPPSLGMSGTRSVPIPQGRCTIPSTAQAYSLNATVLPQGPLSFLTLWPAGQAQPLVSTLNAPQGQVLANAAIVPAGTSGAINVFASNATDVILDINGYFDSVSPGLLFTPLTPCRAVDTRPGQGTSGAFGPPSIAAASTRDMALPQSRCALPAVAQAYSLNATVVPPGPLSYLTLWPTGQPQPFVSTLNAGNGGAVANAAIVPAGANGAISAYGANATDLILDLNGYFAP